MMSTTPTQGRVDWASHGYDPEIFTTVNLTPEEESLLFTQLEASDVPPT
ncbi:MAG: hypothetical protein AAFQ98_17995 [Bacteroidota bacterium]